MKKIYIIILFFTLTACESDPIEEGVVTNIKGTIYDNWNMLPFPDLKLKVAEYKQKRAGIYTTLEFIKWIDSSYTNTSGQYNFDFETSGQGDLYKLFIEEEVDVWTYYYDALAINIGQNNTKDLDFLHLYPINLEIDLVNLDFLPISIDVDLFPDLPDIQINNGTIERLLYTNKHTDTEITFRRKNSNGIYESYTVIIPASNTSNLTTFNLIINNSDFN